MPMRYQQGTSRLRRLHRRLTIRRLKRKLARLERQRVLVKVQVDRNAFRRVEEHLDARTRLDLSEQLRDLGRGRKWGER